MKKGEIIFIHRVNHFFKCFPLNDLFTELIAFLSAFPQTISLVRAENHVSLTY